MAVTIDGTNGITTQGVDSQGTIKLDGNYPTGTGNVALGDTALDSVTTGNYNVAIGSTTMTSNTTGQRNTAVGMGAFDANTSGSYNVAIGQTALGSNTTANNNTAVGYNSLNANTTGADNTAVGYLSGYSLTTGGQNTFVGYRAGVSATTGQYNTFVGKGATDGAGAAITTGAKNTILGGYNGNQGNLDIRTSSNNIVLSDGDGNPRLIVAGTGNIAMGNETNPNDTSPTNGFTFTGTDGSGAYFNIGHNNTGSGYGYIRFIYNGTDIGQIAQNGTNGVSYNTSSDYRLKENVVDLTGAITRLNQLPVHQFNFIGEEHTVDGFLAHEAATVVPEAVTGTKDEVDDEGNPVMQGIDQSKLVPLLTAALKEAITEIESLKARVTALESN